MNKVDADYYEDKYPFRSEEHKRSTEFRVVVDALNDVIEKMERKHWWEFWK